MLRNYFIIFLGGGLGASLRYWLSGLVPRYTGSQFPYGTLCVNILGCFLIGFIISAFDKRFIVTPSLKIFLTIGLLGGFTTFSTFSYETFAMLQDNEILKASLYIFFSMFIGLGLTYIGFTIGKLI